MSEKESSKSASKSRSPSSSPSPPPKKHKKKGKSSASRDSSKSLSRSRSISRPKKRYTRSRSFDHRRPRNDYDDGRYGRRRSPSQSPPRHRRYMGDRKTLQENPPESRCLGVFGLNLRTDERALRNVFEKYGPIDDIQLVYDYHSGMSRGFGFIYYKYIEDAIEARDQASGMDVDGRKIRVDFSITQRAHTPTPGTYLGRGGPAYRGGGGGGGGRYSRRSPMYKSHQRSYSRSRSVSPRGGY